MALPWASSGKASFILAFCHFSFSFSSFSSYEVQQLFRRHRRYAIRGVPLLASVRFGWSSLYPKLAPPSLSASFVRYDWRAAYIWRLENNTWIICRRLDLAKISQRSPQNKIERARQLHFSVRNGRATSNFEFWLWSC